MSSNNMQNDPAMVTGATGFVGHRLAWYLAEQGQEVHVLVRSETARRILDHPNIRIFLGDVESIDSIRAAMAGCRQVYHVAGVVRFADKDPTVFYRVNVEGTRNILEAAIEAGVDKVVFTSSTGVIGPSVNKPMREEDPRLIGFDNHYEVSKAMAESLVKEYSEKGMPGVIVSPSRVYGPGVATYSNGVNRFIAGYIKKRFSVIPYCDEVQGNYVYIDDVVHGHILAMDSGRNGEKYILGGENVRFSDFIEIIRRHAGIKGRFIRIPKSVIKAGAFAVQLKAWIFQQTPELTPRVVDRLFLNFSFSSDKAVEELGYNITSFDEGIQKTIRHLKVS